jgi:paraquat-inducible protein A
VFIASIMVPMLKLSVLVLLTVTAQRRSRWRPMQRTKLYRIVEHIGRWSMLDVFVVTLTVALVRFQSIAVITAGPGAIAFGSVVILTMIASMQFDPRLIWDPLEGASGTEGPRGRTSIRSSRKTQGTPDARTQEAGTPRADSSDSAQGVTPQSQDSKHD